MENISKNITYAEAIYSATALSKGVSNVPNATELTAMRYVAANVFEPLRAAMGEPVKVNSFFRTPQVNALIGGASGSQHMKGEAMDIARQASSKYTNADLFWHIHDNLNYDQLIWEMGNDAEPEWVHVSLKPSGNRRQVLQAYKQSGLTKYKNFLIEKKRNSH